MRQEARKQYLEKMSRKQYQTERLFRDVVLEEVYSSGWSHPFRPEKVDSVMRVHYHRRTQKKVKDKKTLTTGKVWTAKKIFLTTRNCRLTRSKGANKTNHEEREIFFVCDVCLYPFSTVFINWNYCFILTLSAFISRWKWLQHILRRRTSWRLSSRLMLRLSTFNWKTPLAETFWNEEQV